MGTVKQRLLLVTKKPSACLLQQNSSQPASCLPQSTQVVHWLTDKSLQINTYTEAHKPVKSNFGERTKLYI